MSVVIYFAFIATGLTGFKLGKAAERIEQLHRQTRRDRYRKIGGRL